MIAYSPDGRLLAEGLCSGQAVLFDAATGRRVRTIRTGHPTSVAFSPDGRTVAVLGARRIQLRDTATGALKQTLTVRPPIKADVTPGNTEKRQAIAFSPDGRRIAASLQDVVTVWDLKTAAALAAGQATGSAGVWSTGPGRQLVALQGGRQPISSIAFSADGQAVATIADDLGRVWRAHGGEDLDVHMPLSAGQVPPDVGRGRDRVVAAIPAGSRLRVLSWPLHSGAPPDRLVGARWDRQRVSRPERRQRR